MTFWPALALAVVLISFVLASVHVICDQLQTAREQELQIHAQRVASALKAQLFERYADSQAFSLLPSLRLAIRHPTLANKAEVTEALSGLLGLYQVYRASSLISVEGRLIAAAGKTDRDRRHFESPDTEALYRARAADWKGKMPSLRTRVSEMILFTYDSAPAAADPKSRAAATREPMQSFTSPILDADGTLLGVITNYTNGLYLEREMSLAFNDFNSLELPPMTIYLSDSSGTPFASFRGGQSDYAPAAASIPPLTSPSGILTHGKRLIAWHGLSDSRIHNAVNWKVALETDRDAFFAPVSRLRTSANLISLLFLSLVLYAAYYVHRLQIGHQRSISKKLHDAQEQERSRISREIHDDLGQNITAIKIHLSRTPEATPAGLRRFLDEAREMIDETIRVVRRISHELHPGLVERLGLENALRWKLDQMAILLDADCQLTVGKNTPIDELADTTKIHVFRMVQESLNNVQKHSAASKVHVRFERRAKHLMFSIHDNGVGFRHRAHGCTMGLRSIDERAKLIGGKLRVSSKPGQGTTVICRIPMEKRVIDHEA